MTSGKGPEQPGAWHKTPHWIRTNLARVSWDAAALWWHLSSWCAASSATGDDRGVLPWLDLHVAVDRKITEGRARKLVAELAREGVEIVRVSDAGIDLGDWWRAENPGPEVWADPVARERWARAKRLKRDTELCTRVKNRDRNLCRYCGVRVNWNDRNGPVGGTYDHVDPDGTNELTNVVCACRRCNGRKRDRTPEQAGMVLLRPGTTAADAAGQIERERARRAAAGLASSVPGQPAASPRPTALPGSRARPDRADPGLAGPTDPSGLTERARAPIDEPEHLETYRPPTTDDDYREDDEP